MMPMLKVCEIFTSLQGESAFAGYLCTFIRLSGCNLRCVWCDTRYSHMDADTTDMAVDNIIAKISEISVNLVEITGGEPLLQSGVTTLCMELLHRGYQVMIETNGTQDISVIPPEIRRIVDIKCPDSGFGDSFLIRNLEYINTMDEIKFVLASLNDAQWAKNFCDTHRLTDICPVTFSPVRNTLPYDTLAGWMIKNHIAGIRFGIQLNKIIWGDKRGV